MNDEVVVPSVDRVLVFSRSANGDVAPLRVIQGSETKLNTTTLAVDPVHELIVIASGRNIQMFNRLAEGNVAPRSVISGPKTQIVRINQLQVYGPRGWIVATQPGAGGEQEPENTFIGIWGVSDQGDVPPRWKLGGAKSTLKKPRGVVLNPKHKELIVADMRLNSVLTYYFPELF